MKRKITAILAADVAGYSKLVATDEERTIMRLEAAREVFDELVKRYGGRIFNTAGDAVLAEFASAVEAVRCALEIQESLRTKNLGVPETEQMNFRLGINLGDVIEKDGDLLGDGVNIAARLEGIAEPGGICVSRAVYEQVQNKLAVDFASIGPQSVKNIPNPIHVYRVSAENPLADRKVAQSRLQQWLLPAGIVAIVAIAAGATTVLLALKRQPLPVSEQASSAAPRPVEPRTAEVVARPAEPAPPAAVVDHAPAAPASDAAIPRPETTAAELAPRAPEPSPPPVMEAAYDVTLWCEKLAWTGGDLYQTKDIALSIKSSYVEYTRPIHFPTLTSPVVGIETGTGTLRSDGRLVIEAKWTTARRYFTARYEGRIDAAGGTLKGIQDWVSDGRAYKRPCTIKLSRSR